MNSSKGIAQKLFLGLDISWRDREKRVENELCCVQKKNIRIVRKREKKNGRKKEQLCVCVCECEHVDLCQINNAGKKRKKSTKLRDIMCSFVSIANLCIAEH